MKATRQEKAEKIILQSGRRMMAKLLKVPPYQIPKDGMSLDFCYLVRDVYEKDLSIPDRLLNNFDIASIII